MSKYLIEVEIPDGAYCDDDNICCEWLGDCHISAGSCRLITYRNLDGKVYFENGHYPNDAIRSMELGQSRIPIRILKNNLCPSYRLKPIKDGG